MWALMDGRGDVSLYTERPHYDAETGCWLGRARACGLKREMFPGAGLRADEPQELLTLRQWGLRGAEASGGGAETVRLAVEIRRDVLEELRLRTAEYLAALTDGTVSEADFRDMRTLRLFAADDAAECLLAGRETD